MTEIYNNTDNKPKYFLYTRKSNDSEDKQMASIQDQIDECQKIADRLGLEIVDIISESKSAKTPGARKGFNELLERIYQGEAQGILCWKLNRLARNPVDGGNIMWSLQEGVIQHIQTFSRDYKPSDNVLLMAVELGMATQYSKDLSVDVKRGTRQKASRGWYPASQLPMGYSHVHDYNIGEDEILPNDDFPIIKKLWRMMLTGKYSLKDIQREGDKMMLRHRRKKGFGNLLTYNTYRRTLTDPFYCGLFEWKDGDGNKVQRKGKHKTMITEDEFNTVQQLLGKRGRPTRINTYQPPYREHIHCGECGCSVTSEHKLQVICTGCKRKFSIKTSTVCPGCKMDVSDMKNPSIIDKTYYRCTKKRNTDEYKCSQKCLEVNDLETQLSQKLDAVEIPKDFYDWAVQAIEYIHANEIYERNNVSKQIKKKETELLSAVDGLLKMQAEGEISPEKRRELSASYETELAQIREEIRGVHDRCIDWVEIAGDYLEFAKTAPEYFRKADDVEKTEILRTLGSNLVLKDKKLVFTTPKPLEGLVLTYGLAVDKKVPLERDLSNIINGFTAVQLK